MEHIESDIINEYIIKESLSRELDFISSVCSPFHALGLDAFVYDLAKKRDKKLNGLVFIYSHPKNGILINENNFRCIICANIKLVYVNNSTILNKKNIFQISKSAIAIFRGYLKTTVNRNYYNKDLYFISVADISIPLFQLFNDKDFSARYVPKFVIIDEGLGNYMDEKFWKLTTNYDGINIKNTIHGYLIKKTLLYCLRVFKKMVVVENRLLFTYHTNGLTPNEESIKAHKEVLTLSKNKIPECIYPLLKNKWALIATQPFVDYGQINDDDYIKIIRDTLNILKNNGFGIALKPHPRESIEIYGQIINEENDIVFLPKSIILEDVLQLCPNVTIGLTSTALITSTIFYEVCSISVIDILFQFTDDPLLKVTAKQFKEKFGNIVCFVNTMDELNGIISEKEH